MKKSISLVMCLFLLLGLSACGEKEPSLEGTYRTQTMPGELRYTFQEDGGVSAQASVGGFIVYEQDGTYELNEDETTITLTFPVDEQPWSDQFPSSMTSFGGAFTFSRGEDYIYIGAMRLEPV